MPKPRLFLIDAHALCYRAFYAIRELATSQGQSTNAVYGFINTLKKIDKEFHPEYWAVCFDTPARTHREEKYARYKIQRPVMPDDLISQIPVIQDVLAAYRMCCLACDGYEADDIIATIVRKLKGQGVDIVIASDDKDVYQLAAPEVSIYHSRKGKILGYQEIETVLGVDPRYEPDLIGLAGDPTDNIPGIKGIGPVSAKRLINIYGKIENIFQNLDQIKSASLREKLRGQEEMASLSKQLAQLEYEVPIEIHLKDMKSTEPDYPRLFKLFSGLEFKRWAEEVAVRCQSELEVNLKQAAHAEDIQALMKRMEREELFLFMTAGDFTTPSNGRAAMIYIAFQEGDIFQVPCDRAAVLAPIWENPDIIKIGHDIKNELKQLWSFYPAVRGPFFDVMLAAYLLNPSQRNYEIPPLAWQYLNLPFSEEQGAENGLVILRRLYPILKAALEQKQLLGLFHDIEMPLTFVLAHLEDAGVRVDRHFLQELSAECETKIQAMHQDFIRLAGQEFNLNSPKQLSEILFKKLKLPVVKKTKTGFSTDEEVLRQLSQQHELPARILDYRHLAKLKSTYIDALPKLIDPHGDRIHAVFNQVGTETGRLSSNNPNLQNIPIRTELGAKIRRAFIPSTDGRRIVSADYSQIELRILAHLSRDQRLNQAFQHHEDIHRYTAGLVFDIPVSGVTAEMRAQAKRINFGIIYGMSPYGLSKDLGISLNEAEDFIRRYFQRYPGVKEFMETCVRQCEEKGYVLTLLNRRRYIPEINSPNTTMRQFAQRQAINTPVQGSAADLIKLAMIKIDAALTQQNLESRMIISIHDELVFDAPQSELERLAHLIRDKMENCMRLTVPIRVTVKQGYNWLDLTEIG